MRVRRRVLQTPVLTYRRRGRPGAVTLIGVTHIGEVLYYQAVAALADQLEAHGAVVHYEMIGKPPRDELDAASGEDLAAIGAFMDQMATGADQIAALMQYYGWAYQTDALPYPARWRNTDMHGLQLIRAIGTGKILARPLSRKPSVGQDLLATCAALGVFFRLAGRVPVMMALVARKGQDIPVILGERNKIALDALPADGDVVLIWGADHLRGIGRGLRRAGFRQAGRTWLDVGMLPPLRRSLADLLRGIRQISAASRYERGAPWPPDPDEKPS